MKEDREAVQRDGLPTGKRGVPVHGALIDVGEVST